MSEQLDQATIDEWRQQNNLLVSNGGPFQRQGLDGDQVETLPRAAERANKLRDLLFRIHCWDHMDTAADGPYWRKEIDVAFTAPTSAGATAARIEPAGRDNAET